MGEKRLFISCPNTGLKLEACICLIEGACWWTVLCHPHPLYGGHMDNHIVTTMQRCFQRQGLSTLRFNFRGTGRSTGRHGDGIGEREDVVGVLDYLRTEFSLSSGSVILAGYSFGADVAAEVGAGHELVRSLVLVAPPTSMRIPESLYRCSKAVLLIAGEHDKVCSTKALALLKERIPGRAELKVVPGADHFFTGELSSFAALLQQGLLNHIQ
jgi:hypothetical protein